MQNEFEKQVQQKMEELKLVPTDPVWQKVEMQIRRKKDRRRLLFWIPLLILLLGGGLWMDMSYHSNQTSYKQTQKDEPTNNTITPLDTNSGTPVKENKTSQKIRSENYLIQKKEISNNEMTPENAISKNNVLKGKPLFPLHKESTNNNSTSFHSNPPSAQINKDTAETVSATNDIASKIKSADSSSNAIRTTGPQNEIVVLKTDSLKRDSSVAKPVVKKHQTSKWSYAFVASAGASGFNHFNLFNGQKSMSNPVPGYNSGGLTGSSGSPVYYAPSNVEKGFSFSAGAAAIKQLGKRVFFSTGLQYNYYSNTIHVGSRVMQNRIIADFAVSQYFSNTSAMQQPYLNQYHFISIPAAMDWQLLKKTPLNFHAGLSLQYLIQTNALRFDYSSQSYFHNKKAFNSTQLFSELALTYSIPLKQKALTLGPQLQYGLSRLEKSNAAYHLYVYGVKLQWQLNKK